MLNTSSNQLRRDTEYGFLNRHISTDQLFHPVLVSNQGANTMLKAIRSELRRSEHFTFSIAFAHSSAIAMLKQALIDFPGRGVLITSTYLGFNSPATFRELLNLPNVDVFIHSSKSGGFHPKGYLFEQKASTTAIIGSSNLTSAALLTNHEWNLRFSALPDGDIVDQLRAAINAQLAGSAPLTHEWINEYAQTYIPPQPRMPPHYNAVASGALADTIAPNSMQTEALEEIQKVRDAGETRAVVVSATGTGKTILSALDVRAANPQRMLFVVHREQILDRAIEEFRRVLNAPASDFGKFVGSQREIERKYVFATVQSLTRPGNLELFGPRVFDYVIIDEVHRAGAESYRRLIDFIRPAFLLGITATPERTDDFNIFELFDYNVPYEIRLQQALEEDMLAPFHYYGVTDFEHDGEVIDDSSRLGQLVAPERADHLVRAIEMYGHAGVPVRGLMFCSRKDEARELSRLLNDRTVHQRRLRTRALTGEDSIDYRERVVEALERGELDYIVTVDVFNEGIDIPSVNQVVMLRQTQSSIVFTQQLGRGLRKAAGKDHLVVIDFIGNYTNNYLIPIALFGNSSLNRDSVRKDIIEAQESGAIAGLSSVNFDRISSQRIFDSLAATRLDSIKNIKQAFNELRNRLGHAPRLMDFARFDVADPVVVANKKDNYWNLLVAFKNANCAPNPAEYAVLSFLSAELLNGKRPHELLLLDALFARKQGLSQADYVALLEQNGCTSDHKTVRSVARILSLAFFTDPERQKYRHPVVDTRSDHFQLTDAMQDLLQDVEFAEHVRDIVETGLYLARHRYSWHAPLEVGHRYSRKDVCRLLNWEKNEQGTIFGYKVDYYSDSCPIFITYHKHQDVTASTAYGDEFINESALHWFTRSRRTLKSSEVQAITANRVPLHLFAKKDDAEGTDFYYLGRAHSSDAEQKQMPGNEGQPLDVVTMTLGMESPIEASLYEYLTSS